MPHDSQLWIGKTSLYIQFTALLVLKVKLETVVARWLKVDNNLVKLAIESSLCSNWQAGKVFSDISPLNTKTNRTVYITVYL